MRKVLFLVIMCLIPASLIAMEKITDGKKKENFAKVIRLNDYVCNSCNDAYFMGQKHKGLVFRVLCNNDSLAYRVTITPSGKFIVEPW